ncbi:MAG TPA: lysophospholipid acyltransferase family protein [Thermoanaerobaculia bacterium]
MIRRACSATLRLVMRTFFRRIEIAGAERLPASGPLIFVLNHPNGLVDPLFLLCFSPRPVSFLAKAPLFRIPVVGFFVRAFGSIPVHRRQDPGSDVARNRETFARARDLLARGGVLALFPEGASHDAPKLLALKTGAARIALGVAAEEGLRVVPASLYYTWKTRFRSSALLSFGDPIPVEPAPLDDLGEPDPEAVRELTRRIERALSELTLQAEDREALDLVRRAERVFSIEQEEAESPLADQLELRRRFVAGAALLRRRDPERFERLVARVARFESERREAGLPLAELAPGRLNARSLARLVAANLVWLLLLPFAAVGAFLHYPAYRLAGILADAFARGEEDQVATIKAGASILLFPATWLVTSLAAGLLGGPGAALVALPLAPLSGYAALRVRELLDVLVGRGRAILSALSRTREASHLLAERRAIHEELVRVAEDLDLLPEAPESAPTVRS